MQNGKCESVFIWRSISGVYSRKIDSNSGKIDINKINYAELNTPGKGQKK